MAGTLAGRPPMLGLPLSFSGHSIIENAVNATGATNYAHIRGFPVLLVDERFSVYGELAMTKLQLFTGERLISDFIIKLRGGDVDLTCKVFEKWVEKLARSMNCGRSRELSFKKTVGVTLTERQEFEAAISSSLGKGVAELKSEIRNKSGIEISFAVTHEEEEKFKVEAPKCGRTTFQVYQLLRLYDFSYNDNRSVLRRLFSPLKKDPKGLDEWLNQVFDASATDEIDPDCLAMHPECGRAPLAPPDGYVCLIFEDFGLLTSYKVGEQGIILTRLNVSVPAKNIEELLHSNVTFSRSMIPPYLLFLTGVKANQLTARVQPYKGEMAKAKQISRESSSLGSGRFVENIPVGLLVGGAVGVAGTLLLTTKSGRAILQNIAGAVAQILEPTSAVPAQPSAVGAAAEHSLVSDSRDAQAGPTSVQKAAGAEAGGNW